MNIVSIYTSDHSESAVTGWPKELVPAEKTAGVTFIIKVNFNISEGRAIIQQYKIINQAMFIVSMNDAEMTLFILTYAE